MSSGTICRYGRAQPPIATAPPRRDRLVDAGPAHRRYRGRADRYGRTQAELAGQLLGELELDDPIVICSPRRRTLDTAKLAGLTVNEVTGLLAEWDYGSYEGLTTPQIRESEPDWLVWTHGCPAGESVAQVNDRADSAVALALEHMSSRDVLFVSHGHFSRAVITRWVQLPLAEGSRFAMPTASIGICGFEHGVRQLAVLGLTGHPQPIAAG